MEITAQIADLNAARALLDEAPWLYAGDMDIREGGLAIKVDRRFLYAQTVECTDLQSAIGQDGVAMIETNSVSIPTDQAGRRRIREALKSCGYSPRKLVEHDRNRRAFEIAYALYQYGYRDTATTIVIKHDPDGYERGDENMRGGEGFEIDERVDGEAALQAAFLEYLN